MSDISTHHDFVTAVHQAIEEAHRVGWPSMAFADPNFADWPLNDAGVIEHLTRWALPNRRLTLLALDFDLMLRHHPRFVEWRRLFSHVIDARSPDESQTLRDFPTLLLGGAAPQPALSVIVLDRVHWRGRLSRDEGDATFYRDHLDAILQRSVPAFGATTLGL